MVKLNGLSYVSWRNFKPKVLLKGIGIGMGLVI